MMLRKRRILVIRAALAMVIVCTLFASTSTPTVNASLSQVAGISSMTEYAVPGSDPWGITFDSSGRVWVAMPGCDLGMNCSASTPSGKLALFDPNTKSWSTIVALPAGYGQPTFVAIDQSGRVWFTMPTANAIGMYDPGSAAVSRWTLPTLDAGPFGIAVDSQGKIWFCEHYTSKIGLFDPVSQNFQEFTTPTSNSQPYGIVIDRNGNKWFTENAEEIASIGEYTSQGVIEEYKIRNTPTAGTGLTPHLITLDQNGNIWWSEGWASAIGMLNVASARPGSNQGVTEYHYTPACSACNSHTSGIGIDGHGLVWFDDSLQNDIGSLPIGGGQFSFYPSEEHPHDGLAIDKQDRIWLTQESGNHLVLAI